MIKTITHRQDGSAVQKEFANGLLFQTIEFHNDNSKTVIHYNQQGHPTKTVQHDPTGKETVILH